MYWPRFMLLLALLVAPLVASTGPAPVALPAGIGDLALPDGRVLRSVVVLSQTGLAINVRHAGGLMKLEKQQLPPELRARFPIDEAQAAQEEQAAAAARARREEQLELGMLWIVRPARPGSRAAGRYADAGVAPDSSASPESDPAVRVASAAEQAKRAPKGLYITTWSNAGGGEIKLEVANPTTSSQKIEPRELVALRLDNGRSMLGSDLRFRVQEKADPWVAAGERRTFRVQFVGAVSVAAVAWVGSGEWRVSGPYAEAAAVASEEDAMTLARANDKEARERTRMEANKSRAAKALDKLDDRLIGK